MPSNDVNPAPPLTPAEAECHAQHRCMDALEDLDSAAGQRVLSHLDSWHSELCRKRREEEMEEESAEQHDAQSFIDLADKVLTLRRDVDDGYPLKAAAERLKEIAKKYADCETPLSGGVSEVPLKPAQQHIDEVEPLQTASEKLKEIRDLAIKQDLARRSPPPGRCICGVGQWMPILKDEHWMCPNCGRVR